MTEERRPGAEEKTPGDDDPIEERVRSILRRSTQRRAHDVDLLGGVQKRIRERSRGRFYGDGWSRRGSPTSTYVVTSLLMLAILLLVYFVILPGISFP